MKKTKAYSKKESEEKKQQVRIVKDKEKRGQVTGRQNVVRRRRELLKRRTTCS